MRRSRQACLRATHCRAALYKVMGLAPYGQPVYLAEMRRIVRLCDGGRFELDTTYFRHHREKIDYAWAGGSPHVGTLFSPALEELLGPARGKDEPLEQRHRDIARSVQAMYEEASSTSSIICTSGIGSTA